MDEHNSDVVWVEVKSDKNITNVAILYFTEPESNIITSLVQNPAEPVSYQPHGARYNSNTFCFLSNEIFCWDFYLLDDVWLSKCWDWWDTSLELVSISTRPSQQQFIFIDRRNKNTYQHSLLSCLCLSIKGFSKGTELINWKYH